MPANRASHLRTLPSGPVGQPSDAPRVAVARAYMPDTEAALPYLHRIDAARWYSNHGPLLLDFEARLAARFGVPTAVSTVASGTLALIVGLQAAGAAPGAYCILPSWTFVATAHAVIQAGLKPWFLDVDRESWMLDPEAVRDQISDAPGPVGAVVPVAAFGRLPDMAAWARFHDDTGLPTLIDAAASFDALDDAPLPTMVSLHATKILGVGEGGFIATRDIELAATIRERTSFGFRGSRVARVVATNAKLSEYAAALGHAGLDRWSATRMRYMLVAQRLRIALMGTPEVVFQPGWGTDWISSTCVVGLPAGSTDHVEACLAAEGIETRRWWGDGCHLAPAFRHEARGSLSITEHLARSTLGLPFALDLSEDAISRIVTALGRALASWPHGAPR